jgi:hypothetical protein
MKHGIISVLGKESGLFQILTEHGAFYSKEELISQNNLVIQEGTRVIFDVLKESNEAINVQLDMNYYENIITKSNKHIRIAVNNSNTPVHVLKLIILLNDPELSLKAAQHKNSSISMFSEIIDLIQDSAILSIASVRRSDNCEYYWKIIKNQNSSYFIVSMCLLQIYGHEKITLTDLIDSVPCRLKIIKDKLNNLSNSLSNEQRLCVWNKLNINQKLEAIETSYKQTDFLDFLFQNEKDLSIITKIVKTLLDCKSDEIKLKLFFSNSFNVKEILILRESSNYLWQKIKEDFFSNPGPFYEAAKNKTIELQAALRLIELEDLQINKYLTSNPKIELTIKKHLAYSKNKEVRLQILKGCTNPNLIEEFKDETNAEVLEEILFNPTCPFDFFREKINLLSNEKSVLLAKATKNSNYLDLLAKIDCENIQVAVAQNLNTNSMTLDYLANLNKKLINSALASNPNCPLIHLKTMIMSCDYQAMYEMTKNEHRSLNYKDSILYNLILRVDEDMLRAISKDREVTSDALSKIVNKRLFNLESELIEELILNLSEHPKLSDVDFQKIFHRIPALSPLKDTIVRKRELASEGAYKLKLVAE